MQLINEVPPIKVEGRIVACEGGQSVFIIQIFPFETVRQSIGFHAAKYWVGVEKLNSYRSLVSFNYGLF